MPITGSGTSKTFTRTVDGYTGSDCIQQMDAAKPGILSTDMDETMEDMATGIRAMIMRDGGNLPLADLPMNSYKHTGVGNASARTNYAAAGQVADGSLIYAATSSNDTITASLSPAITAYATGMLMVAKAGGTNTGAATINVNSVGAKSIKKGKAGSLDVSAGDMAAGRMLLFGYDGTNMQLLNAPEFPTGTVMLFNQTSAPTGWTKNASTGDDSALRLTTGTVSSGGSVAFTTAFVNNRTVSGTVAGTTLTENQIPSHRHFTVDNAAGSDATEPSSTNQISYRNTSSPGGSSGNNYYLTGTANDAEVGRTSATGGGASHDHSWSGTVNMAISYVDIIRATKD
jgi:hypothetical protein